MKIIKQSIRLCSLTPEVEALIERCGRILKSEYPNVFYDMEFADAD